MAKAIAKKKHTRVGENVRLDLSEADSEQGVAVFDPRALLRNFVRKDSTTVGTAFNAHALGSNYDGLKQLKTNFHNKDVVLNEPGTHFITIVMFDKGTDGNFRFIQVVFDELQVNA